MASLAPRNLSAMSSLPPSERNQAHRAPADRHHRQRRLRCQAARWRRPGGRGPSSRPDRVHGSRAGALRCHSRLTRRGGPIRPRCDPMEVVSMSIASKLVSLLGLALAAMAVAAAPAFATHVSGHTDATSGGATAGAATVTPTGTYSGTETEPGLLESDNGSTVSCDSSDFEATVLEDGTVSVTTLTFGACTANIAGQGAVSCTVVVTSLPANLQISFASPRSDWTQEPLGMVATISCAFGTIFCQASTDTTLAGTISNAEFGT